MASQEHPILACGSVCRMSTQVLDVVIVGAGFGGIGAAIQLSRMGYEQILVLDREDDLGGTWHVNRYPGLTVDVPSPTFSYWFEPNPYWSRMYAPGTELKRYATHVSDKYDVRRFMRFNTVVEAAQWDDDAQVWNVTVTGGEVLTTRYLILATGFLCQPATPDIPGIDTFEGHVVHTARWDHEHSFAGRRAAVIGTGSTAVQVIPELAKQVDHLTVYQRTPIWVMPKLDTAIPTAVQRLFAALPLTQRVLRWFTDAGMELLMLIAMWRYRYFKRINITAANIATLHRFLSVRDKELRRKLTPAYDFGCKRPTVSNSYYRALTKPHVLLETAGIDRIESDGIVSRDGVKQRVDTLVLATGFDVWESNLPAIEVIGRGGRNLGKWWRENTFQAYQGVAVPSFPNFLTLASPFAWLGMSWFNTVEFQMRHMHRLFGELQRRNCHTFEVTEDANTRFLDRMNALLDDSVFHLGNCAGSRSYWFNHSGQAPLFRPTSVVSAVKEQDHFPLDDYSMS